MIRSASRAVVALWLGLGLLAGVVFAAPPTATPATAEATQGSVAVQPGDMASVLAFRLKPRGSTIEQMMVALLRSNPEAFVQGNVNVLREGAVLRLPAPELVLGTSPEQAREWVQQHHQAFLNGTPAPMFGPAQAPTAAPTADSPAKSTESEPEDLRERLRVARARLAQLEQNIQELERLTALGEGATASAPPSSPSTTASVETGLPASWLWLMVCAIIAAMVGIGYGRATRRPRHAAPTPAPADAQLQARLQALDLDLGPTHAASPHLETQPTGRPT